MIRLDEVERRLGELPELAGPPLRVQRMDPKKDGGLFVQVEVGGADRWFRVRGEACVPVPPEEDRKLALARELPALRERADVRVLAYRPERRIVVHVRDDEGERVLKGYRAGHLAAAVRNHERASAALASAPVRPPRLLAVDEDRAVFTMESVHGRPLGLAARDADRFHRIGAALRALQVGATEGLPAHGVAEEFAVLDGLLAKARGAGVSTPPAWPELRRWVESVAPPGPRGADGLAHRDLHDGQFLECADGLVLFDFDMLAVADPVVDAANLLAHLRLRELQGLRDADERTVAVCGRALLDGLARDDEDRFRERLRFYEATTFLRLSLVYALRRRWAHLSPDLLEHARRRVDDR